MKISRFSAWKSSFNDNSTSTGTYPTNEVSLEPHNCPTVRPGLVGMDVMLRQRFRRKCQVPKTRFYALNLSLEDVPHDTCNFSLFLSIWLLLPNYFRRQDSTVHWTWPYLEGRWSASCVNGSIHLLLLLYCCFSGHQFLPFLFLHQHNQNVHP